MPNCVTSCDNVDVPYPFGIGPNASCYLPGFNLAGDTSGGRARGSSPLLPDADKVLWTPDVGYPFLQPHRNGELYIDVDSDGNGNGTFSSGLRHAGAPYTLASCQMTVKSSHVIVASSTCTSLCDCVDTEEDHQSPPTEQDDESGIPYYHPDIVSSGGEDEDNDNEAYNITDNGMSSDYDVQLTWLGRRNRSADLELVELSPVYDKLPIQPDIGLAGDGHSTVMSTCLSSAFHTNGYRIVMSTYPRSGYDTNDSHQFVALPGLIDKLMPEGSQLVHRTPAATMKFPARLGIILLMDNGSSLTNVSSDPDLCKSKQSHCYTCECRDGFHGNPYIPDASKGESNKSFKGTKIIIGVAIGVVLLLLALIAYFTSYKFKHWSTQSLKWKYFKKKHGQLLQQLVPQRADIAEKMIITLEGLEKATNNFDKAHELGRGGHAIVYKGILSDLHIVAIKKPTMVGQREIDEFINEVAILSQINHRNIVKLYGCCLETEVPLLVYEFISNGTLYGHLHVEGPRSLPWDARLRIATEIAKSLAYLHSTAIIPIIHGDVKPANILLDDTLTAKIADFGASRYISLDKVGLTRMVQGTIGYMDPMYFRTCRLTVKSDVYSFGVMLIELMTRKKPFNYMDSEGNGLVAHFSTLFAEGSLSQVLDPQVMDEGGNKIEEIAGIAISCVKLRGEERPTMRQVEMRLEAAQPHEEFETISPSTRDGGSSEGLTSRQYSIEEEYMLSARYPR
ncbi:wall-associated receptor kinase 3-like [Triticum aestivum]|uniref:wall-associated receptor kinase 3-like n=1 Tax=Triticum aestivum TaxID=4565 RepID=UPI001D00ACAF|nr:wall-associated receptor kinase 3-like [Triticum aestivum]